MPRGTRVAACFEGCAAGVDAEAADDVEGGLSVLGRDAKSGMFSAPDNPNLMTEARESMDARIMENSSRE